MPILIVDNTENIPEEEIKKDKTDCPAESTEFAGTAEPPPEPACPEADNPPEDAIDARDEESAEAVDGARGEDPAGEPTENTAADESPAEPPEKAPDTGGYTQDELAELRDEVGRLRGQLTAQNEAFLRMSHETAEFAELFPDRQLKELPGEVWEYVRKGIPLAAAHAYNELRRERQAAAAAEINLRNSENSAGSIDGRGRADFYSPAEVRGMSAAEVRANYTKIMDSMKLWS